MRPSLLGLSVHSWRPAPAITLMILLVLAGLTGAGRPSHAQGNVDTQLVFASYRDGNGEIYVMHADGSNQTNLTNHAAVDDHPVWSPDRSKIAFLSGRDGNNEIYVMDADGSNQTRLTNHVGSDEWPTWSPDGSKIAFASNRDGNNEIYVMGADGSNQTRLTNHAANDRLPVWSPDGSRIAFDSDRDGDYEIYVMDADGANPIPLTNNVTAVDLGPAWSPDSSRIAFTSNRDEGDYDVYVMDAGGGNQQQLTADAANDQQPVWSPDGSRIAFASNREGDYEIYVMSADGSNQAQLTHNLAAEAYPDWSSTGTTLPMTGNAVPELAIFDQTMQDFMVARQIPAGTLTVMKDGVIVLERGYGWQDRDRTLLLQPDAMLRLASIIKPVTAAAILKLIEEDLLNADDRVFCLTGSPTNCILNITPFGTADANAVNITIQHLLDHEGGWDRDASFDPMFRVIDIANDLGVTSPPTKEDIVRYMLGQPLDFVPGTDKAYSDFGYLLLGLVIEKVTGQSFTSYIQNEIFTPLCVPKSDIELGHSLPNQRNPREPWYSDPNTTTNVFDTNQTVLFPDGGFYIEAMEAHGGMIASSSAMAKFLEAYWIDGQPRTGDGQDWTIFGSLPGTHTLARQRSDGINIVALFNQRIDPSGANYEAIKDLLDSAADSVTTWPNTTPLSQRAAIADFGQQVSCFFPSTSIVVDRSGGILKSYDGTTTVIFPEDAVTEPISITITPVQLTPGPNFPGPGFTDLDLNFVLEAFNQSMQQQMTFQKPVQIINKLELKEKEGKMDEEIKRIQLCRREADEKYFQALEAASREMQTIAGGIVSLAIVSNTNHFSTFAVLMKDEQKLFLPGIHGSTGDSEPRIISSAIDAGGVHTCDLTTSSGVNCWGGNNYRQVSDDTAGDRLTPVDVIWP